MPLALVPDHLALATTAKNLTATHGTGTTNAPIDGINLLDSLRCHSNSNNGPTIRTTRELQTLDKTKHRHPLSKNNGDPYLHLDPDPEALGLRDLINKLSSLVRTRLQVQMLF